MLLITENRLSDLGEASGDGKDQEIADTVGAWIDAHPVQLQPDFPGRHCAPFPSGSRRFNSKFHFQIS